MKWEMVLELKTFKYLLTSWSWIWIWFETLIQNWLNFIWKICRNCWFQISIYNSNCNLNVWNFFLVHLCHEFKKFNFLFCDLLFFFITSMAFICGKGSSLVNISIQTIPKLQMSLLELYFCLFNNSGELHCFFILFLWIRFLDLIVMLKLDLILFDFHETFNGSVAHFVFW